MQDKRGLLGDCGVRDGLLSTQTGLGDGQRGDGDPEKEKRRPDSLTVGGRISQVFDPL